jgi:hypothetical protein
MGFGLVTCAEAFLVLGFLFLDIPNTTGPAEDPEFLGHVVVAHS